MQVARENGHVLVAVSDDGIGGADPGRGTGLRGLADRLKAIEGRLEVESYPGVRDHGEGEHPVRVVVADDSVLLREGVVRLLEEAGLEVVGQAGDADDLRRKVYAHKPDVAIVDVRMPPDGTDDGLRAALEIRERQPETAVLVLSQYVEECYAMDLVGEGAGGVGYLLKDRVADLERFTESVRARGPRRVGARPRGGLPPAAPQPQGRPASPTSPRASARRSS